ncbi:MAG: hypothetical protein LBN33_04340 [Desulfovibrio sp.]|nr:hypothetical protein [Desulfovibrio sp.]
MTGPVTGVTDLDISGGWISGGGNDIENNIVNVFPTAVLGAVDGAIVGGDGNATNNTVNISGGTISDDATGGYTRHGNAIGNSVTISGGTVGGQMSGGLSNIGDAAGNTVTVNGGTVHSVRAGHIDSEIDGVEVGGAGNAYDNTVNITGGTIGGVVYGGSVNHAATGNVYRNKVNLTSGTIDGIQGGNTHSGNAYENTVTMNGGSVTNDVVGGDTDDGGAYENSVTISGGTVGQRVVGGGVYNSAGNVTANKNTVTISGGTVGQDVYGGRAASDTGTATADNNTVTIKSGATVSSTVYGGKADSIGGDTSASNNTIKINGGTVGNYVHGGSAESVNGNSSANNNTVSISGGTVSNNDVMGGVAEIVATGTGTATAKNNSVNISGGTFGNRYVFGGLSVIDNSLGGSATGSATDNTVTISGSPDLSASTLYGGFVGYEDLSGPVAMPGDAFSGNTMNLKSSGLTVKGLYNFEYLNFFLPTDLANGGTMLNVTNEADITNSKVNVGINGSSSPLGVGDAVSLIRAGTLTGAPLNSDAKGEGIQGVTLRYEFDLLADNSAGTLTAKVTKAGVNEQAKALSEGFISGVGLVTQGGDMVAGRGMESAVRSARDARAREGVKAGLSGGYGISNFGSVSGGSMRYNTGSHVNMSSISLMAGISKNFELSPGFLTLGAFFEYGNGSYDTYNSFSNAASVHGDGDIYYIGGGIIARMDFMDTGPGHFYAEVSGRAGKTHNEYNSSDLQDMNGVKADYDSSAPYYGIHAGLGYVWNITDKASLDLHGKYFWTRQEGDSVKLSTGESVRFDGIDSTRARAGARFAYTVNEYIAPYIGAAYEHEFDGKATAKTNGYSLPSPDIKGGTGIGELGFSFKPSQKLPLSFDLGVQGYTGKREGVTGSLEAKLAF